MAKHNINNLTVYYQNCRGMRTKLRTIFFNIMSNSYDIIILSETWLNSSINDNEFIDQRYIIYRCDRDLKLTQKSDGGGVLVAVMRCLKPYRFSAPSLAPMSKFLELVLIQIPSSELTGCYLLGAVYIPDKSPIAVYNLYFEALNDILRENCISNLLLVGDYNIPDAHWQHQADSTALVCMGTSSVCDGLRNFMTLHHSSQYNGIRNSNGRILDLCITNITDCFVTQPQDSISVPIDVHHPPFYITIPFSSNVSTMNRNQVKKPNFYKANYDLLNKQLMDVSWNVMFDRVSAEESVNLFYETIYDIVKKNVPLSRSKSTRYPVWFSPSLIHIFKNKRKAWNKWKIYKNESDYEIFSLYRTRFKSEATKCYNTYINYIEDSIPKNTKYFWSYISNKKSNVGIPSSMTYNNQTTQDPETICNLFSSFFQSVYQPSTLTPQWSPPNNYNNQCDVLLHISFDLSAIKSELKKLDPSKGPGPDGLPAVFLKNTANTICEPLHIVFNKCICEGFFPDIWKCAYIVPIHKSGSKHDVTNYRPISIISATSKLFEKLVHNAIYPFFHNYIISEQHGFVKQKSTMTNLAIYTNFLFHSIDKGVQVDSVYTDFQKAFDRVDHEILLNKIAFNGIRGNLLRWFCSYICNRSLIVVINGYKSGRAGMSSGIPQGSILGPLLFIIFINDINKCFKHSNFLLYADDLKLYKIIKNPNDCSELQSDLNRLSEYCTVNKLNLSIPKCQIITFTKNKTVIKYGYTLCGTILNRVTNLRDLGILFDSKLHLDLHIENIINKAFKMYGFVIRTATDFRRPCTFLHLYRSLIRSQLEYACLIWDPLYSKYKIAIEKVQRKFLRAMQFRCQLPRLSYEDLLARYNLLSLEQRRMLLQIMTLHDLYHNKLNCIDLNNYIKLVVPRSVNRRGVRDYRLFDQASHRTNAGKRAPLWRLAQMYNEHFIDIDLFVLNRNTFRGKVIDVLRSLDLVSCCY